VLVVRDPDVAKVRCHWTLRSAELTGEVQRSKRTSAMQTLSTLRAHTAQLRLCTQADAHPLGTCITPKQQLKCCGSGGNHRYCSKWKEAKTAAAMLRYGKAVEGIVFPRHACAKFCSTQANSRTEGTWHRLEPHCPRGPHTQSSRYLHYNAHQFRPWHSSRTQDRPLWPSIHYRWSWHAGREIPPIKPQPCRFDNSSKSVTYWEDSWPLR
jgi:hypothetical protein